MSQPNRAPRKRTGFRPYSRLDYRDRHPPGVRAARVAGDQDDRDDEHADPAGDRADPPAVSTDIDRADPTARTLSPPHSRSDANLIPENITGSSNDHAVDGRASARLRNPQ